MAFVPSTHRLFRAPPTFPTATSPQRMRTARTAKRSSPVMIKKRSYPGRIPQGFTPFSELMNGRAAMMGFFLAVVTEAITGKGILGQVGALLDLISLAAADPN